MNEQIIKLLEQFGVSEVGFSKTEGPFQGLNNAISIVIKLSDAIIDQIEDAPTHTYFHHYRTINAYIDHISERLVLFLQNAGYSAAAIPASQSTGEYQGLFSHKKAAVRANIGAIGKSALFISKKYGARVRLGTVFTDAPLKVEEFVYEDLCGECNICTNSCAAMAIKGKNYEIGMDRSEIFDAHACSQYMKEHFQKIGRGAVCGVCMKVCPKNKR